VGHVRGARPEAAAALIADRRGLASRAGHDPRAGPVQPVDLGRAGLEIEGFRRTADGDDGPSPPEYRQWVEAAGYGKAKDLLTYEVNITNWSDPSITG
jgi:hypothetical protein